MPITKAMILAGGKGTRLRPLTFNIPKPLLPVGERSILEILVERLRESGIRDIVLSVGYRAELVRAFCGDGSRFGVRFHYVDEEKPLGTAGPLASLEDYLDPDEGILLMNGDIVTGLDFSELAAFHEEHGFELTIAYKEVRETSPFGVLQVDDHRVQEIVEKPTVVHNASSGIYALSGSAIREVPKDRFYTVPELATLLMDAKRAVGAFRIDAYWLGVERFPQLEEAIHALDEIEESKLTSG